MRGKIFIFALLLLTLPVRAQLDLHEPAFVGAVSVATANTLTNGLWAYWNMDETSGTRYDTWSTYHLTEAGSVYSSNGIINGGAYFNNNVANYLIGPTNGIFDLNGFSLSYWVKLNGTNDSNEIITKGIYNIVGA